MKDKNIYKSEEGKTAVLRQYQKLLTQCYAPYEELFIETRYGKTYVLACGGKSLPPLILLHGSGSNSSMWIRDIPEYAHSANPSYSNPYHSCYGEKKVGIS